MVKITVEKLAKVIGITAQQMLQKMKKAGLSHTDLSEAVTEEDKANRENHHKLYL